MSKVSLTKWAIGGLGTYLGYKFFFEDTVFEHIRIKDPQYVPMNSRSFASTEISVEYSFRMEKVGTELYLPKLTKFKVTSRIKINVNRRFNDILEFKKYYRPLKDYTISNYDSSFGTLDGVLEHERKHQDEIEDELKDWKKHIKNITENVKPASYSETFRKADGYLSEMKKFFDGTAKNPIQKTVAAEEREDRIRLEEWSFYHEKYEEEINKR